MRLEFFSVLVVLGAASDCHRYHQFGEDSMAFRGEAVVSLETDLDELNGKIENVNAQLEENKRQYVALRKRIMRVKEQVAHWLPITTETRGELIHFPELDEGFHEALREYLSEPVTRFSESVLSVRLGNLVSAAQWLGVESADLVARRAVEKVASELIADNQMAEQELVHALQDLAIDRAGVEDCLAAL